MPRPKSYDREAAIADACMAFWQHGYQALGVRELERLTGLNQFAIRTEFGGKEGLYLEALTHYADAAIFGEMASMTHGGIDAVIAFLEGLTRPGSPTSSGYGCLIVNTGIENARIQSDKLEAAVNAYWQALERHFLAALRNEQIAQGDEATFSPEALAASLVTAVMGIHARNRSQQDQTAGRPLGDLLCAMLQELKQP